MVTPAGPAACPRPLRADAARNRVRILDAAREVFAERGLDVTLDDIARHAGVGVGTVYRRFASREALVEALFEDRLRVQVAQARAALEAPDAWTALVALLESTCRQLAVDRGLHQVMLSSEYGQDRVAVHRQELIPLISELVCRAQRDGHLRPEFTAFDIPVLFLMIASVADFSREVAPDLWQRWFAVVVDGLRARPPGDPAAPLTPGLQPADLDAAMVDYRVPRR